MKKKNDFMTNSSSSNFIICYNENDEDIKGSKILQALINKMLNTSESHDTYEARELTLEDCKELYGDYGDDEHKGLLEKKEKGWKVFEKSIGYEDMSLVELLHFLEEFDCFCVYVEE